MSGKKNRRQAFTIVEILVVVSIIALLMALLLPALSGVKGRSRKTSELSHIRQVGIAWNLYAGGNDDATVPGYLEPTSTPPIIQKWDLSFEFPQGSTIPDSIAAPWTWRLMPYFNNNYEVIRGYTGEERPDSLYIDMAAIPPDVNEATIFAEEPAFGYNAYYTGGWWDIEVIEDTEVVVPRFYDHVDLNGNALSVTAKSIGAIRRQSGYITFCSSAKYDAGVHRNPLDLDPGSWLVVPLFLADVYQWDRYYSPTGHMDPEALETFMETHIPIGRHTGQAAVLYADGHTSSEQPSTLYEPRMWINATDQRFFEGQSHEPTSYDGFLHLAPSP